MLDLFPEVDTDVLIVHDRQDVAVPFLDSEEIAETLSTVMLHETDGLGHRRILTDRKIVEFITEYIVRQSMAVQTQHSDLDHNPATVDRQPWKLSAVQQF